MRILLIITACLLCIILPEISKSQIVLPSGFSQVLVAPGITEPTTMEFAPDGRIFVAQQSGKLRVVKNGVLLSRSFINLNVNTNGERGLLGIAFDPSFNTNQYVYLCYTVPSGAFNRISRFSASGDTVVPGSEEIIFELDTLIANFHTGGHLGFGIDGKLYIATGENGRSAMSQSLDSYLGKILRINSDGTVAPGNPFTGHKRENIWAYGLRNPFTFAVQPGTGRLFVNDVGEVTWEEINDVRRGGLNFGWPNAEGVSSDTAYEDPFYTYIHGTATHDMGCAITGGTFFNPDTTNYPASYIDRYFYMDYCGDWINMVTLTDPPVWSNFASNTAKYSVGIKAGPDGNLYYLSRNDEALYMISYTQDSFPLIVNEPQSLAVSLGHPATFSVTASGTPPLTYQWRKGTTQIGGATNQTFSIPSVAFSDSGDYNVVVTNTFGNTTSADAHLSVIADQPPTAVIDTPILNQLYSAGDTIFFHGSATDPEDGNVPDSVFKWVVVFHHNTHVHPGPSLGSGISSGSFIIPNVGETSPNVFYRLILIVHDASGLIDSSYVDINPRTSTLTINTQPQGLIVSVDGQPFTAPQSILSVEGMIRTIGAAYSQSNLFFTYWNNGGPLSQSIPTPAGDTILVANYDSPQLPYSLGPDTTLCVGDSIMIHAGSQYSTFAWTDGSVSEAIVLQASAVDTIKVGVTVVNTQGEVGSDSIEVIVEPCSSVPELGSDLIKIFPNPSGGEITISGLDRTYSLIISDMAGRNIFCENKTGESFSGKINLEPGIYSFLVIGDDHRVISRKNVIIIR